MYGALFSKLSLGPFTITILAADVPDWGKVSWRQAEGCTFLFPIPFYTPPVHKDTLQMMLIIVLRLEADGPFNWKDQLLVKSLGIKKCFDLAPKRKADRY